MKKIILAILALNVFFYAHAESSMKKCTILPVIDDLGGAIGSKVYSELEESLKSRQLCEYTSNSGLISIFSKYRDNLSQYLKSPKVISTVAEKLKVGSILKIDLTSEVNGIKINFKVLGENGEDVYFDENLVLKNYSIESILEVLVNWIEVYARSIPYDGLVRGVLGDQITVDAGGSSIIKPGFKVIYKRMKSKKVHPLFKKIVDWETDFVGEGIVLSTSDNQVLTKLTSTVSGKKVLAGDWIRIDPTASSIKEREIIEEKETPGVLGEVEFNFFASSTALDRNINGNSGRMSGNLLGAQLNMEAWITRNYFAGLEFTRGLGTLKKAQGDIDTERISSNILGYKVIGGYKYLPTGFFYGPSIDLFGGISKLTYDSNFSREDGFGEHSFSGFILGITGELPLNRAYRIFSTLETIPFPTFQDDSSLYGNPKNVIFLDIEFGMKYALTTNINLNFAIEATSRKAKFSGAYKEISYKDTMLKIGSSLNF